MKELSDDELDKLFRASAEEFEPTYQPNGWEDLRRRLDGADGVAGGGWLRSATPWIAGLLLLLLAGTGIYYWGAGAGSLKKEGETIMSSATEAPNDGERTISKKTEADDSQTALFSRPEQPTVADEQTGNEPRANALETEGSRVVPPQVSGTKKENFKATLNPDLKDAGKELPRNPASVSGVREPTDPIRESGDGAVLLSQEAHTSQSGSTGKKQVLKSGQRSIEVEPDAANETNGKLVSESNEPPIQFAGARTERLGADQRALSANVVKLAPRPLSPSKRELPYPTPTAPYLVPAVAAEPKPATPEVAIPKWSVRVGIAPDLSMAGATQMMESVKAGPSASLLVDVNVSKRWAIQTGVITSLKNYVAMGSEYTWPESWSTMQKQRPNSVDGSCRVIEIPLNVRFDIRQTPTSRWFMGAGVSSYKLMKESYEFNYESYDPATVKYDYKEKSPSPWAIFCHANASFGYEHRLTKRLSILAEPYVRVPLQKLGHGQINLFSGGVWFSARYTPVFRSR